MSYLVPVTKKEVNLRNGSGLSVSGYAAERSIVLNRGSFRDVSSSPILLLPPSSLAGHYNGYLHTHIAKQKKIFKCLFVIFTNQFFVCCLLYYKTKISTLAQPGLEDTLASLLKQFSCLCLPNGAAKSMSKYTCMYVCIYEHRKARALGSQKILDSPGNEASYSLLRAI